MVVSTNILVASSNVKFYTGITTTDNDLLIERLVPIIQSDIVNYCKNYFTMSTMYIYDYRMNFSSNGLTAETTSFVFNQFWTSGNIAYITGTIFNDGYYSISTAGSSNMTFNESVTSESSTSGKPIYISRVSYPLDLEFIASRMIRYLLDNQSNQGIQSESLGDYSYTLTAVGSNMYPQSIVAGLMKYRKAKFK